MKPIFRGVRSCVSPECGRAATLAGAFGVRVAGVVLALPAVVAAMLIAGRIRRRR
jgi:hypothetical protein